MFGWVWGGTFSTLYIAMGVMVCSGILRDPQATVEKRGRGGGVGGGGGGGGGGGFATSDVLVFALFFFLCLRFLVAGG